MPVNDHLKWVEVKDYSAGLWTAGSSFTMPPNAFQRMEGIHPRPANEGGARAFYKPTSTTVSGIGSNEVAVWMENFTNSGSAPVFMLITIHTSTGVARAYTRLSSDAAWTLSKTFSTPSGGSGGASNVSVSQYIDSSGNKYLIVGVTDFNSSAGSGVWAYNVAVPAWTLLLATYGNPNAMYQSRIISIGNSVSVSGVELKWTDIGATTFSAPNYLDLLVYKSDVTAFVWNIAPVAPSQLVAVTAGGMVYSVDGDITDPVVHEMSKIPSPLPYQRISHLDDGPVLATYRAGLWQLTNSGATKTRLDPQLTPYTPPTTVNGSSGPIIGAGSTIYRDYLFAPGGRIMHIPSGSWFTEAPLTVSAATTSTTSMPVDYESDGYGAVPSTQGVYVPTYGPSFAVYRYDIDSVNGARNETWTIKTAPLHDSMRQIVMREVQVNCYSYHANSTVAVTVGGITRTSAALSVGAHTVVFLFAVRGDYLDVTITGASNSGGSEAPLLESHKIGYRTDGHQLR